MSLARERAASASLPAAGTGDAHRTFAAAPLRALVAMESFKLRRRPMTTIVFLLMTAGLAALMTLSYVVTRANGEPGDVDSFLLPDMIPNAFDIITALGPIVLVVLAASIIGSEFSWGTVRVLVGSGTARSRLLTAKLVVLLGTTALLALASLASALVTSLAITLLGGHDLSFGWLDAGTAADIGLMFLRSVFVLLVPTVLAFAVATVTRSLAAGIAVGIGFMIGESILWALLSALGSVGETLAKLLISVNTSAITRLNTFGTPDPSSDLPGPWQAAGVLTLYIVALLAVSYAVFRRRDVTAG